MERNYYIKSNYKPNEIAETIDTKKKKYWLDYKIKNSRMYYQRYYLFKNCKKLIKKKKLKSVLDIGCGPAFKLMKLIYPVCSDVYGIDQEHIIKINRKKYGLNTFFYDNIENSKLNLKKKFDLIISSDIIEHLIDPDKLLNYIKKYSHENTYILITTPERDIIRGKNCDYSPNKAHIREWNKQEFYKYLIDRGFKIIFHDIILNYKLSYLIKNSFDFSRMFNSIEKIKHSQLVICKLKDSEGLIDKSISKLFKNNYRRDILNILLLKIRLFLLKMYDFYKKTKYKVNKSHF